MKLKRFTGILAAFAVAVNMLTAPVSAAEKFPDARETVGSITAGWNLGNSLDSNGEWIGKYSDGKPDKYETAWGNPVTTAKTIAGVKKAGFNAVRVPVTWREHIDDKGNIDKEWLDRVHEVVDLVIAEDMYCILNVHHDGGSEGWLEASADSYKNNKAKFAGLWKNIAVSFKDYGDKLLFESFNEMLDKYDTWNAPKDSAAYDAINSYNQLFVDTVRKTGGNNAKRCLMVQTYAAACGEDALKGFKLPKDSAADRLIVQVHNYDPWGFTADEKVSWTTMTEKWGSDSDKKSFDELFARLGKYSGQWNAPVVVGEYGANFKDNDRYRAEYGSYFVTKAGKYGIKCFWWDTGNMGLIDRTTGKAKYPEVVKAVTGTSVSADKSGTAVTGSVKVKAVLKDGTCTLSWGKVKGADSYTVYRCDEKTGKLTKIASVKGTSCKIKKAAKGSCYKVEAYSGKSKTAQSETVKIK